MNALISERQVLFVSKRKATSKYVCKERQKLAEWVQNFEQHVATGIPEFEVHVAAAMPLITTCPTCITACAFS